MQLALRDVIDAFPIDFFLRLLLGLAFLVSLIVLIILTFAAFGLLLPLEVALRVVELGSLVALFFNLLFSLFLVVRLVKFVE